MEIGAGEVLRLNSQYPFLYVIPTSYDASIFVGRFPLQTRRSEVASLCGDAAGVWSTPKRRQPNGICCSRAMAIGRPLGSCGVAGGP